MLLWEPQKFSLAYSGEMIMKSDGGALSKFAREREDEHPPLMRSVLKDRF